MPEEVNQNPTNFKVFVAIPAHEGATKVPCTIGLLHLQQVFFLNNIPYEIKFETGCPYISMARNNLIAKFMQSDCTDLLFIDDDVGFPLEAVSKIFNYDVDVIAGIYPKRKEPIEWPVILKVADGKIAIENGIVEAENLPTGFMRIKREVIQKIDVTNIITNASCDFSTSGSVALSERLLTPKELQVNLELCKQNFVQSWEALQLGYSAFDEIPKSFTDFMISYLGGQVAQATEISIWQGNAAVNGQFNGLSTQLSASVAAGGAGAVIPAGGAGKSKSSTS